MARKPQIGPAADPELLILSSLAAGPNHGYGIMIDIAEGMQVTIGPGTLYTAITRLVEKGLVAPEPGLGRQRPYRLTEKGGKHLETRLADMRRLASFGLRRLRTA